MEEVRYVIGPRCGKNSVHTCQVRTMACSRNQHNIGHSRGSGLRQKESTDYDQTISERACGKHSVLAQVHLVGHIMEQPPLHRTKGRNQEWNGGKEKAKIRIHPNSRWLGKLMKGFSELPSQQTDRRGSVYPLPSPWGLLKSGPNVINSPISFTHVWCKGLQCVSQASVKGSLESHDMVPIQKPAWKCFTAVLRRR